LITWLNVAELPEKSVVALYWAERLTVPACRARGVSLAMPPLRLTVPSVVPEPLKVTEPVGMPPEQVTFAVKVTATPKIEGLSEEVTVVVVVAAWTR
jgi:hypothetical protein